MKAYKKHQSISRIIEPKSSLGHQGSISNILHQYQKKDFPVNTQTIQRVVKVVTRAGDTPHDMTVQETISWLTGYFTIVNTTQLEGFLSSYDEIYVINDNFSKEHFKNDYISFIHDNKSYIKTGEDLIYGRRTITLEDSDGGSFDLQFKKAIGFIRAAEKLSEQIARLLIYTRDVIRYDYSNKRDAIYTDLTPSITDSPRKKFTGELGRLLAEKAIVCREKAAFGQILLSELGIDTIAVYGYNQIDAHAWLKIPDSGIEIDPTWGTCEPHTYPYTENASGKGAMTVAKYKIDKVEIERAISETQSILKDEVKICDINTALQRYLTNPRLPKLTQSKAGGLVRRGMAPGVPVRRGMAPGVPVRRGMAPGVPVRRGMAPGVPVRRGIAPKVPIRK